jgi:hypothetical protein
MMEKGTFVFGQRILMLENYATVHYILGIGCPSFLLAFYNICLSNAQRLTVFYYMRKTLVYLSSHDGFKLIWMLTRKCSMTDASYITIGEFPNLEFFD